MVFMLFCFTSTQPRSSAGAFIPYGYFAFIACIAKYVVIKLSKLPHHEGDAAIMIYDCKTAHV